MKIELTIKYGHEDTNVKIDGEKIIVEMVVDAIKKAISGDDSKHIE